ncbi:hypothetical protein KCU81_g9504, partial [Aureobasidium melanogenum]|uniref:Mid2 domain-containing protein n=1 Tax=Aureobasidium melanogenum (strain CBS 110374) TaxID=1043003 RepID=A0A074WTV4_AURM1
MFTPALTAFGTHLTGSPSPSLSSPATVPTTLIHAVRQDDSPEVLTNAETCGYTSGAWSSAVTCGSQQSCTYYSSPNSAPNFGCCSNGLGCGYVSTCLDYRAKGNFNTYAGVAIAGANFLCGSYLPYCSTLLLYGTTYAPGSTQSFYYYSCQIRSGPAVTAFQTTFDERDKNAAPATTTTSASSSSSSATTTTTEASSTSTSTTSSSSSSSESSVQTSPTSSLQSTQTSSGALPSTKANIISSSPNDASSTIAAPSTTSTNHASPNGISQTSQIGIAVGVSIGACILLASIAFLFFRHRKAKADKRWLDQPSQTFPAYLHHMDGSKAAHPFDYRSDSFRTNLSGKSASEGAYELSSTGRTHELSAGDH